MGGRGSFRISRSHLSQVLARLFCRSSDLRWQASHCGLQVKATTTVSPEFLIATTSVHTYLRSKNRPSGSRHIEDDPPEQRDLPLFPASSTTTHSLLPLYALTMRPSDFIAVAMTGAASLASADASSSSCSNSSDTTTTTTAASYSWPASWPVPTANSTSSMSTLSTTIPYVTYTSTTSRPDTTPHTSNTTGATTSATSTVSTISGSGATPADGLSGDRSVLGLVIFFALSLCLL